MAEAQELITYHVYGRTEYARSLEFITAVAVPPGAKPPIPEGKTWIEVVAFPATAVVQVIPWLKEQTT